MDILGRKDIDWHIHTIYSDGTMSPTEVVEFGKQQGLTQMAITDHDGITGVDEAVIAGEKAGVQIIKGIELSALDDDGIAMHILGYNIDPHNAELKKSCEYIREKRQERNQKLLAALAEEGYTVTRDDFQLSPVSDFIGKPVIARAMIKKGYINNVKEAFTGILSSPKIRVIKKEKISAREAVSLIKNAGGTVVLAHPGLIGHLGKRESAEFYTAFEEKLASLVKMGFDGIECDYSQHSEEEKDAFCQLAKKYELQITRGSDFHGDGSHMSQRAAQFPIMQGKR